MSTTKIKKKKRARTAGKADNYLKVCPKCNGVWSDISLYGERNYNYYPKGIPTYGKKRAPCKLHRDE